MTILFIHFCLGLVAPLLLRSLSHSSITAGPVLQVNLARYTLLTSIFFQTQEIDLFSSSFWQMHYNLKRFRARPLLLGRYSLLKDMHIYYEMKRSRQSFPPDTKGFLYYSMSPERPCIAGELRFRVTSSDNPASFEKWIGPLANGWSAMVASALYILAKIFPSSV